jgi:hypothetical protein
MTSIHNLISFEMLLQALHNLDSHLEVVLAVSVNELAHGLSLVRILDDDATVVSK